MLCPGTMLHSEMVLLECHNPSSNQGLISGIRFEPRESLIVNPKDELSGAEITVILQDEIISCVHFKLGSAILRLSGIQLLATIHNWSQGVFRPEDPAIDAKCRKLQQHWHQCPAQIRPPSPVAPRQLPQSKPI